MAERDSKIKGTPLPRCPGTSVRDLALADTNPVPAFLYEDEYENLGSDPIPASRYTDPAFFALENERMWPRVWQMAAREEELPEPGDYIVYENAGKSFILMRQVDGAIRAFANVCLHRGRKLKTQDGWTSELQCPFHGFTWNNDGSLKQIPCRWDFAHLKDDAMHLPEISVGRWGGYIFVREAADGPSLEEFLAPMPEHFKRWRHEECATAIWVGKVIPANWKVVMEAFMESWHTVITHPQLLPFTGDANSMYNIYGDHVNLTVTPFGTMSPHIDAEGKEEQWIVDEFVKYNGRSSDNYDPDGVQEEGGYNVKVPAGMTARAALGASLRDTTSKMFGHDVSFASDAEMMDALLYNVFPNYSPWAGFQPNIVYRWRPWPDVDHCLMEVRIITRVPPGQPHPKAPPMKLLTDAQKWTDAPELGILGDVFEQDMENIPYVQQGLKASLNGQVQLANYQEMQIRQFQNTLMKYIDGTL
ncbi:aromatic ring-hydroxylating oxygenase subunit alpha [Sphingobium algorifonticola]|uniref:Aromatic ring-hydroxylating dioxygenase subunit alpha n=1 Tax=Sphingobium algorifonticola TaxID=2008318 RepID=A0A437J5X8_9SPHN|nr:aromatic ring-hydroxylating dioxygenase subunit alpha [Sphingobium algorifonticola]RVT40352.1 aromatic ring-hydroxylating dioxygenase subunit alpha [Sphingobium algorifonticola]